MTDAWRLGRFGRTAVAVAALMAVGGLGACAPVMDPENTAQTVSEAFGPRHGDMAMAAVARGDYTAAVRYAMATLKRDPKDPQALVAAGMAYQGLGQYEMARQYYQVILTTQVQGTLMVPGDGGVLMPRTVADIARSNLAVVEKITGRSTPRSISESGKPPGASAVGLPPMGPPEGAPRIIAGLDPLPDAPARAPTEVLPPGRVSDAENNVAGRFRILKALLDQGLITPEEYAARRTGNLGALLPYTEPTPGQGLERPIPKDTAVIERLKALATALEGRALGVREHAAERTAILDALLPSNPKRIELPVLPPRDMIEAGAAVGRLERMKGAGLVSADEAKRERDAIERALERHLAGARVDGSTTGLRHGTPAPYTPGGWTVHLASAKSDTAAKATWAGLKAKYGDLLGKLEPNIAKVTVKGKGTRWRLVAGPLDDKDAATKLCKALKVQRVFCDPLKVDK